MVITGTVVSWSASARTAVVEGIPGSVAVARHIATVTEGDTALLLVEGGRVWLVGLLGSGPVTPPVPDEPGDAEPGVPDPSPPSRPAPPPAQPTVHALRPSWSGSWRGGAWRGDTSDLYQGDWTGRGVNSGACWWGRLPSSIIGASLILIRSAGAGVGAAVAPTMTLLAGISRPAGAASVVASAAGPSLARGGKATWALPPSWVTALDAGTAGGVGITSGGSSTPYLALLASGLGMTLSVTTDT